MSLENSSPHAIATELGERLKQARLNANLTQTEVAAKAGITRKVVGNAEKGQVHLESMVAILLALDMAGNLESFLPRQEVSPVQLLKLQGQQRVRASGGRADKKEEKSEW